MIEIRSVETKKDWDSFIDLPWKLYKGDPYWVPPLRLAVRDQLDVDKNPFFRHAYMYPVLAIRDGEVVGRIVGVVDSNHNRFHKSATVFFGFFECINDQEVAHKLCSAVSDWGKSWGMNTLSGPVNLSTNFECGLLIDGFNDTPSIMMTYNPPYYQELFESWGLVKAKDLLAYSLEHGVEFSDRLMAHAERLKRSAKVTFRPLDTKRFDEEVDRIAEIYNDAWEENWGFVPMNRDEFRYMAREMKPILDPRILLITEVKGEPVGFALTLPDVNVIMRKIPTGKLLPTGFFKLLWYLKGPARLKALRRCRILTFGVRKAYQQMGIGPLIYVEYMKRLPALGYDKAECSWILEDNEPMNKALRRMNAERSKVYRIYAKAIEV